MKLHYYPEADSLYIELKSAPGSTGHESANHPLHANVTISLSPPSPPRLSSSRPVRRGGASRGDPEVGQSESWPEG